MIPRLLVKQAARAVHQAHGRHLGKTCEETPQWYRDAIRTEVRTALEAVAADIWDEGLEAGHRNAEASRPYNEMWTDEEPELVDNPYRASETA